MASRSITAPLGRAPLAAGLAAPVLTTMMLLVALGAALAFASVLALAVALAVSAVQIVLAMPSGQAWRRRRAATKQRRLRRQRRAKRILGAPRAVLEPLELIVAETLGESPRDPLDLEGLLERYVETATAHEQCLTVLGRAKVRRLEMKLASSMRRSTAAAIAQRRLCLARTLERQAAQLDESLHEIAELICYAGELARAPVMATEIESAAIPIALERYDAYETLKQELLLEGACNGEHDWQSFSRDAHR